MYGTFGFLGLVLVCWIISMVQVAKQGKASIWTSRGIYVFGAVAVILNLIRMAVVFETYKGTMIFANVIALICILIAFARVERDHRFPPEKSEEE
jgi:hypothetical protein